MGPLQKKLIVKIPAAIADGAENIPDAAIAASAAAVAQFPQDETETTTEPTTETTTEPTPEEIAALYDSALNKQGAQAVSVQRGLPVANESVTKAALIDAIVADGGDGTITPAEQSAIDQYALYQAETVADLQADADTRTPPVAYTASDDTVGEMARLLLAADNF